MSQMTGAEIRDQMELNMSLERLHIPNVTFGTTTTQIHGKGLGVIATTHIPRGALLLAETALFCVSNCSKTLSRPNQRSIKAQAPQFPQFQALFSRADPATDESRFETNNFDMGKDRNGRKTRGIFVQASRFNHSCVPNACFAWNPELNNGQGQLTIYANQDIYPGDEILINYRTKDWAKPKYARQAKLQKHYGFDCDCPACQRQPGHQFCAKSDGRRRRMQSLTTQIDQDNWNLNTPSGREAKRQNINKLIDNIRQEGLIYPALADALDNLGKLAEEELSFAKDPNAMSASAYARDCHEIALQIAREKLDLDVRCNGSQSPVVMAALKCIRDLDD